jgi:hypothetical protein
LKWFIGSIFILSIGTYFLALYIGDILDSFSSLKKYFFKIFPRPSNKKEKALPQLITLPSSEDDDIPSPSVWRKRFEFNKTAEVDVEEAKEK